MNRRGFLGMLAAIPLAVKAGVEGVEVTEELVEAVGNGFTPAFDYIYPQNVGLFMTESLFAPKLNAIITDLKVPDGY